MGKYQELRKLRTGQIRNAVQKAREEGVKINKEKLIALMSLQWNMMRRTVLEYIDTLMFAGEISEDDFGKEDEKHEEMGQFETT